MSLTRRKWTERQRLDDAELRIAKWAAQNGLCYSCTRYHSNPADMDMAHRIPDTKVNRKVYGREVVDHPINRVLTCSTRETHAGVDCNAAVLVSGRPADDLARRIRTAIDKETG